MIQNRIKIHYIKTISKELIIRINFINFHELKNLEKIVFNLSLKEISLNKNDSEIVNNFLAIYFITGSVPNLTFAKKTNLKLKFQKQNHSGLKLILKKKAAFKFLDFFIHFTLPRLKNFKPIQKKDNNGNLTIYISNLLRFLQLEINYKHFHLIKDLTITFVFNSQKQSNYLISSLRIPK